MWNWKKLFDDLGGPSGVYDLLKDEDISYSAIRNWKVRPGGIPGYWLGKVFAHAKAKDPSFAADAYLLETRDTARDEDSPF